MAGRLRWGILGAANIARRQVAPAIQRSEGNTVVALASRDKERGQTVAAELGIPRIYDNYQDLLDDPEIDAIYNPLPNSLHVEWSVRAAEAGKAVLCEKPLARDSAEAAYMARECARVGAPTMEAFMYRFHPQNVRVRTLIAEGAIGAVGQVRAGFGFRMHPLDPDNVRLQASLAGGALMDVGCYAVNAARMVFGDEPLRATAWRDFNSTFGVDTALSGVLEFPNHRYATVDCSFTSGYSGWYMVIGSEGVIEVPRAFTPLRDETVIVHTDKNNVRHEEHFAGVDQYQLMVEAFAQAVKDDSPVPWPLDDAVANMRVLDALAGSAASGGCIRDV